MQTIPTISQLYTSIISDLEAEFGASINPIGKAFLRAIAAVQAGKLRLWYAMLALLQKNVAPDTCDEETLLRFGKVKLNRYPFSAVAAVYELTVTGISGATIAANTIFKSNDDSASPGQLYILDNSYTLSASSGTINVRALTLGIEAKLDTGDTLTATAPIPNVNQIATVSNEVTQPLAAETIKDYRNKVILAWRLEPTGGAAADYRLWSLDAQGVANAYPYAHSGHPCEVIVYVESTKADSADGHGTPTSQTIIDVAAVIEQDPDTSLPTSERGRRPLTDIVNVTAVTPKAIIVTINGLQGRTTAIETLIEDAIEQFIDSVRPFVAGADVLASKNDILDVNNIIGTIIKVKPGAIFTSVSFTIDTVSVSTYTFLNGEIPYKSSVLFT